MCTYATIDGSTKQIYSEADEAYDSNLQDCIQFTIRAVFKVKLFAFYLIRDYLVNGDRLA